MANNNEQFFVDLCNNIVTCVSIHFQSMLEMLRINNGLMNHEIPTSLQLQLSLKSSCLQRSFMSMRSQIEELIRLTKLYSTSWEEKNQCLKALHHQYNIKQRKLDIALKKIEMLTGRNNALEKMRIKHNWEKMFLKVNQNKTLMFGWRQVVCEYQQKTSSGESVAHLFRDVDGGKHENPDKKHTVDVEKLNNELDDLYLSDSNLFNNSFKANSCFDRFSTDREEEELQFSPLQGDENEDGLSSVQQWMSRNDIAEADQSMGLLTQQQHYFPIPPDTKDAILQTDAPLTVDKSINTRNISYSNSIVVKIQAPDNLLKRFPNLHCVVAFNSFIQKLSLVREESVKCFKFNCKFEFDSDYILQSEEFKNATLRIGFHPDVDNEMVAFAVVKLNEITVPCVREQNKSFVGESKVTMLAAIDKQEFRFNQPCGSFLLYCQIFQAPLPFQVEEGTNTVSLTEFVEDIMSSQRRVQLERCRSACVETDEKPVYTEHDLDVVKGDLTTKLQDLKSNYEEEINQVLLHHASSLENKNYSSMATSPVFMVPFSNTSSSFQKGDSKEFANESNSPKNSQLSQQWGKDLPPDFLTRLNMFKEASQQYHEQLKSKTNEAVKTEIKKKLCAEKKLSRSKKNTYSVYSRDVYLPTVFMPIKTKRNNQPIAGRSYLTQKPIRSNLQLPFLINSGACNTDNTYVGIPD
jgi:hypothetical protein